MQEKLAKALITIATLFYGVVPVLADVNPSHILHPEWPAHARFHTVWLITTNSSIALLALYQLWINKNTGLSAALGLLVMFGFWVAASTRELYHGAFVDAGGIEVTVAGLDANAAAFTLVTALLLIGLVLGRKPK